MPTENSAHRITYACAIQPGAATIASGEVLTNAVLPSAVKSTKPRGAWWNRSAANSPQPVASTSAMLRYNRVGEKNGNNNVYKNAQLNASKMV